ncbi:MAG: hypothetical protein O3A08_06155 [Proteobacteria bacterium]|nr:hypothetical protein [Pseudomonadota bacterium]MDA1286000.1 hypothetical protein [Pseudomonadota bacterium]
MRVCLTDHGSVTCPLFQSRGGMAQLVASHPDVDFAILYVRKAHPGAGVSQHKSMEDKQACAGVAVDFLKVLPNLIWNNLVLQNLRLLRGRPLKVLPDHRC